MRAGRDWQAGLVRYLVHFSDGGGGTRHRDAQLALAQLVALVKVEHVQRGESRLALACNWL